MAWILNALFKVIKTMLPEKAVERIKMVKKGDLKMYIDSDQLLKCWGGNDNYVYVFESEEREVVNNATVVNNKKVHFADGSPTTEPNSSFVDKSDNDGNILQVNPTSVITFVKEGNELVSALDLYNSDKQINLSYKMKTTSPEKFRVRPSAGCLAPGERATVNVSLLPGFQLGVVSKDKFLVMSMQVDSVDLSAQDLVELWKSTANKNVSQHRLRCWLGDENVKNGNIVHSNNSVDMEKNHLNQISDKLLQLSNCQSELHVVVKRTQLLQWIIIFLVVCLGMLTIYIFKSSMKSNNSEFCYTNPQESEL